MVTRPKKMEEGGVERYVARHFWEDLVEEVNAHRTLHTTSCGTLHVNLT